jgi:hypothetical protein
MADLIEDSFQNGISPYWVRFCVGHADIEVEKGIARLIVNGAVEQHLSDAEIDDHRTVPRDKLEWRPPLRMRVRARMSHPSSEMMGTAGFGFWNDPFDWVGNVETPPNAIWFFYASPQSDIAFDPSAAGNGWKAAVLNGGRADPLTMAIGNFMFGLPGMSKLIFRLAQTRISANERVLGGISMNEWHDYQIDWLAKEARFSLDGVQIFASSSPPRMPLGFVAWVDNNAAVMGPGREFDFRRIAVPQRQFMELAYVRVEKIH